MTSTFSQALPPLLLHGPIMFKTICLRLWRGFSDLFGQCSLSFHVHHLDASFHLNDLLSVDRSFISTISPCDLLHCSPHREQYGKSSSIRKTVLRCKKFKITEKIRHASGSTSPVILLCVCVHVHTSTSANMTRGNRHTHARLTNKD